MREYYVIIVAALTIVAIGESACKIPRKTPVKEECPSSGTVRLPYRTDCTLYYECQDGKNVTKACPHGLHFNRLTQQCDWPPAGCDLIPNTQPLDTSGCIGTCPISDPAYGTIQLPFSGDCTKFCKCSNGTPFLQNCPIGLHYDETASVCNWPRKAKCRQ
ncbi:peritrophin-1-like [Solenopsis invicta]|uniref:peritrophin-1-like n=1 Tax=Solenopsis invicta TaxID=13686 RepID=UPI000E33E6FF|nr:peritrophin-1-like [Solenopsis invicta]